MNKRQRKQQLKRWREREAKALVEFWKLFPESEWMWKGRFLYDPHPRRHWLSPVEYRRKCEEIRAEMAAEKAALRKKLETHDYTLAGWLPKSRFNRASEEL